jgi:exopolyphosphatase / guanosine-5'-triphosphate,3'-diphosphate pyrophosphatase
VSARAGHEPAPIAAVIDIGSNSVLLVTVMVDPGGSARVLDDALLTTRLGSGLRAGGRLTPDACVRTAEAVTAFAARARARGARSVWAFATAAVRDAVDGKDFARAVGEAAGVPVEVLPAEREATLAFDAVRTGLRLGAAPLVVADVGGRTTELTLAVGDEVLAVVSLPLGALALAEAHGTELAALRAAVDATLAAGELPARARALGARCAASGGTATALAALDLDLPRYDGVRVHGHRLSASTLDTLATRLAAMPAETRTALPSLDPGRAAVLPAGAVVLGRLVRALGATEIVVSDQGVRHAYLREALGVDRIRPREPGP